MKYVQTNMGDKEGNYKITYQRESEVKAIAKRDNISESAAKKKAPKHEAVFTNVFANVPADSEALAEWHKSKKSKVLDAKGETVVEFKGVEAAANAKVSHDLETPRGKAREQLFGGASVEAVGGSLRKTMLTWKPGKEVEPAPTVVASRAKLAEIMASGDLDALQAYLAAQGTEIEHDDVEEVVESEDEIEEESTGTEG